MDRWRLGYVVVSLLGLSCLGAPPEEAGASRASRLAALECGGIVGGDFFVPSTVGDAIAYDYNLQDEYALDAAPGTAVTLEFSGTYGDAFGFAVVVYDEGTGAEIARAEDSGLSEGHLAFRGAASGHHRVEVRPWFRSVSMELRVCGYDYGWGRGRDGGYGYGYACEYRTNDVGIGSREAGGGGYQLSAQCAGGGSSSCVVGGTEGVCLEVSACDGYATPGYCAGASSVQCCTATAPVPDGAVPAGWQCDAAHYAAADGCDCGCGAPDPDCNDPEQQTFEDCPDGRTCRPDGACERVIPPEWICPEESYGDGQVCHCNCGVRDPDCIGSRHSGSLPGC